jgi:hypothetical protein
MPVTIGDFEVVEAPPATPPTSTAPAPAAAPVLDMLALQRLQRQLQEQALRTWAH